MNPLDGLFALLGGKKREPAQRITAPVPIQPMQKQPMRAPAHFESQGPQRINPVTPGYESQAAEYETAMDNGDFNNPIVAGPKAIDPKFFGYGPDLNVVPPPTPRSFKLPINPGYPANFPSLQNESPSGMRTPVFDFDRENEILKIGRPGRRGF